MRPSLLTLFRSLCVTCLLAGSVLTPTQPLQAQVRPAPLANAPLPRPMRGEEALQTLGTRLRSVAESHRMSETQLRNLLQRDRTLWVDPAGRLFYACETGLPPQHGPVGESTNTPPLNPLYPVGQTFKLHSRPGAGRSIFLDFDGHDASATAWGNNNGSVPITRPFDLDGNPNTFSTTERQRIQFIWARVAEDFLHYDIDVTTEDPGAGGLKKTGGADDRYGMRVAIGGHSLDWYGTDGVGGVANLYSFDGPEDRTCWVFAVNQSNEEKAIAEAASHEVGHTLGLFHDGWPADPYYAGHGNWAPIMGVGYDRPIVQWSQGEYSQANNTQDDLADMLDSGAAYRTDDYGDNTGSARQLLGVRPFTWGVISSRTDIDFFSFEAGAGRTTILASPSTRGPNLRIQLALYDSGGGLIISTNVADNATSGVLPVTISLILPAGNYFVSVDGIGTGTPSTGYSDYASLGQYTLTLTLPGDGTWTPTSGGAYSWDDTANWSSATYPLGWSGIARINNNIVGDQSITINSSMTIGGLLLGDPDSSHTFSVASSGAQVLQLGATNGNAWISKLTGLSDSITSSLVLQTNLVVTNTTSADLVLAGNVDGPFSLTKFGAGRLALTGNSANAGLVVSAGTVQLGNVASIVSVPSISILNGAVLDVSPQAGWQLGSAQTVSGGGVITGDVSTATSSRISPGASTPGTLTFANHLTLNNGSELRLNLTSTTNTGGGINDLIAVNGNLNLNGIVTVNFDFGAALPATNGAYTILTYAGTLTGGAASFAAANTGNRFTYVFDDSTPGEIRVHVSGAPTALVWQGDGVANLWDTSTTNWLRGGAPDAFFQNDTVLFDSTGSVAPAVNLNSTLSPANLIVSNTAAYAFGGTGRLTGLTSVTKQGNGNLTLNTSNDFSGVTVVQEGTLLIGNAAALGLTNTGTTISNVGQLNLNGHTLGAERITVSGNGPAGGGALINTGAAQTNAMRNVTLAGNVTIGGTSRWDIRGLPADNLPAGFIGNSVAVTKTGPNEVWFANLGTYTLGNITVNEGTLGFEGTNGLTFNGSSLTVNAGATLAFLHTFDSDFSRALFLNSCTIQNDSGHNNLTGVTTLSGTVTAATGEAAVLDMRGTVVGTGGFIKTGAGALRLAGGNNFSGNITISEGTIVAGNNNALGSAAGTTTVASGARLDVASFSLGAEQVLVAGSGINNRGAIINSVPGSQPNALRFVTLTGDTTFGGNGRWDIRGNPTGSLLGAFNLSKIAANEIWLANLDNTELKAITVTRGTLGIQGTTTLGDPTSTMTVASAGTLGISSTGTNILNKVMTLNSGTILNSLGSNTVAGSMSLSGANEFNTTAGTTLLIAANLTGSGYFDKLSGGTLVLAGNNTLSGASQVGEGTLQIGAGGTTGSFASTLNNSATLVFDRSDDITHAGLINGIGTLIKQNTNRLTLTGANTYSGVTTINAGTLRVGNTASLGSTTGGTTIAPGASLDVNGLSLGAEVITVAGSGVGSAGAVINTGASQLNALRFLTLAGNTTIGGSSRWDLRGVGGNGALSGGFSLTKTGSNTIGINNVTVDGNLGNVAVQQGVLSIEQGTTGLGHPVFNVIVSSNAALNLYSLTNPLNKVVVLEDGGKLSHSGPVSGGVSSTVSGLVSLSGGNALLENSSTAYSLQINGVVSGPGNLNKTGAGLVQLNAGNNYSGNTVIGNGTLKLGTIGSLSSTPLIAVANGTTFDVTTVGGGFVLGAAQILAGTGTVLGNVTANGTIAPGASIGRLTISGNTVIAGGALMELSKVGTILTNDVLNVSGTLTCGGTLTVTRTGNALVADDSFKLFAAGAMTGSFANYSLPTLNPGLAWDTSTVNSDGWLRVVSNNVPVIGNATIIDGKIVVSGSGGAPGSPYHVVTTTNVSHPMVQWWPIATNTFDGNGNFAFTNTISLIDLQQFFRLRLP